MLVDAYRHNRGALRASLRAEYGLALGAVGPLETAELITWLPAGSALWRAYGGDMAISEEAHELRVVEYRLRILIWMQTEDGRKGRNRPKPPEQIPTAGKKNEAAQHAQRQAAAHRRRQSK